MQYTISYRTTCHKNPWLLKFQKYFKSYVFMKEKKSIKKSATQLERAHREHLWTGKALCCKLVQERGYTSEIPLHACPVLAAFIGLSLLVTMGYRITNNISCPSTSSPAYSCTYTTQKTPKMKFNFYKAFQDASGWLTPNVMLTVTMAFLCCGTNRRSPLIQDKRMGC